MSNPATSLVLRQKALIDNPTPRVPICLVLDASGSMDTVISGNYRQTGRTTVKDGETYNLVEGETVSRMDELNRGLRQFMTELLSDSNASQSAEICLVAFSGEAELIKDFAPLSPDMETIQVKSTGGGTSLGKGVKLALQQLDRRKDEYQRAGVEYYQPWLVVITDGVPTDTTHHEVAADIAARVQKKKLSVFPIVVGDVADLAEFGRISPSRPPIRLQGAKFCELFEWLSKSVSRVSSSIPGEVVPLDKKGIDAWGAL